MFSIMSLQKTIDEKVSKTSQYGVKSLQDYTTQELLSLFKSWSRQINHIYWSQKKSALKILDANDRDCYILELDEKPIGILVFKNHPVMEEPSLSSKRGVYRVEEFLFVWSFLRRAYLETMGIVVHRNYSMLSWDRLNICFCF